MNKQNLIVGMLALGCVSLGSLTTAHAQTNLYTFPAAPLATGTIQGTFGSLGMEFKVLSTINVTAVGAHDEGNNGFANSSKFNIYSIPSSQAPISGAGLLGTSVDLAPGVYDSVARAKFVNLGTALTLTPGFYVAVWESNGENYFNDPSGNGVFGQVGTTPAKAAGIVGPIDYTLGISRFGAGLVPNGLNLNYDKTGATLKFALPVAAPEPTTMALMGLGVVGLIARRRKN
jgi:PEP-CTERM motif